MLGCRRDASDADDERMSRLTPPNFAPTPYGRREDTLTVDYRQLAMARVTEAVLARFTARYMGDASGPRER